MFANNNEYEWFGLGATEHLGLEPPLISASTAFLDIPLVWIGTVGWVGV
jgi:hypothetical protein